MFGKKKARAAADKLSARKAFDKLAKKNKAKAELSPSDKIKKQSDSRGERRKNEPAV
jgi:hypothetical protein